MIINKVSPMFYNVIIVISIIVGMLYILISLYNERILKKRIVLFIILFFIFSIIGGKLYTYIMYNLKGNPLEASLSSYGGLVAAIIAAIIYEQIYPTNNRVIKNTIFALPLIYSFTKIGCFIVGCCEGIKYSGPFNITYPHHHDFSLFPIQGLEVIVFFILFLFVNKYKNKKVTPYVTLLFISIFKYLSEFLRYSETTKIINENQIFSIILFVCTFTIYVINYYKDRRHS